MIHVDRGHVPPPLSLTGANSPGGRETERVIAFYSDPVNHDRAFPFEAYSSAEVKQTLNDLFHYKCAYCESYFGATQPVDVEHFRPKGAVLVNGRLSHPGYYWLAASWENLLPACIDCNRKRTQEVRGQNAEPLGKASEFPLADEAKRASAPGQESREERLLLDPCQDDPDEHLVFEIEEGDEVVVRPAQSRNGRQSRMGQESIRVYALRRSGLAEARRERMKLVRAQVSRINRYIRRLDKDPDDREVEAWLREEMVELDRLLQDDQPYACMARQYVKKILGK
jgi:uncharacterized protein (TIGR02646 family)